MKLSDQKRAMACAVKAARAVGKLMRTNLRSVKKVNSATQYDIKLELDVQAQKLIEKILRKEFPAVPVLGEESISGNPNAEQRWVVDPIDGTVNFSYGIPHACVSIAFQVKGRKAEYDTLVGVVYDPFCEELWTAIRGQPARLNGKIIRVSRRNKLRECIVSLGFAKSKSHMEQTLPFFNRLARQVRKMRLTGVAALGLTYVATGRFDAYIERGIRLWDIAAGGLILECAGGEFWREPVPGAHTYRMIASNGRLRKQLHSFRRIL